MSEHELRVGSADLAGMAQLTDHVADQLVDRYSRAAAVVTGLLDGGWKGDAADACAQAWQEWSDGFRLIVMGLHDAATALQLAAGQYASTDGDSAQRIAGA